jgi:hypothetical protein
LIKTQSCAIPFQVGRPISNPANFAGRREILREIRYAMLNLQNVSLHSGQLTGKTSLLLYLAHPVSPIKLPETHTPVYFDFQDLPESASEAYVWRTVADAIAKQIRQRHPESQAEVARFLAIVNEVVGSPRTPTLFHTSFKQAFAYLGDCGFKIHLLFDEFERTALNPSLGDPFYDALRSLSTQTVNISYVIATRVGLAALQPSHGEFRSSLFNIFTNITLGSFQEDEVYRMIFDYFARAGLGLSQAEKLCSESAFLYGITGYHPFFLQTLCYHLCQRLDKSGWPRGRARQEALRAFERDSQPHFEHYWKSSSKEEQELMIKLADEQPIDWNKPESIATVQKLKYRCLVVQKKEPERGWKLYSSVFNKWVNSVNAPKQSQGTESLDTRILSTLYAYFQKYPGDSKISLNELIKVFNAEHSDVIQCLYGLQEKGWLNYDLTGRAESGLIWLTNLGIRVAKDIYGN